MKKISKLGVIALFTLSAVMGCEKQVEPTSNQAVNHQLSTTNLITQFNGYEVWQAPWNIYDEVFTNDPDPDASWQQVNELLYYCGFAIKEMILDPNYSQIQTDILGNLNDDSELILYNFFDQYPQYRSRAVTLVQDAYGVDLNDLLSNAILYDGLNYTAAIHVLENTIENYTPGEAIVAMGIELDGPNHTEAELYSEDYIPSFQINSDSITSLETVIGYDDSGEYKTAGIPVLVIAIVAAPVVVGGVYFLWNDTFTVNPNNFLGSGNTSWQNCELSEELVCAESRFDERYQNKGMSRIRMKYDVRYEGASVGRSFNDKFKLTDASKSDIGTTIYTDLFNLYGYTEVNGNATRNLNPSTFYFWTMIYENDWYAIKVKYKTNGLMANQVDPKLSCKGRMKRPHEYYQLMYVYKYDWCFSAQKTFSNAGYSILEAR